MRVSALLAGLASLALVKGADRKFTFKNNCKQTIWPGFQDSSAKKLIDAEGSEKVMGFMLKEGGERTILVPDTWSGRMWGRTDCKNKDGQFKCATGNCEGTDENCITGNQLATIAEFTLRKPDADGPDNYDLSLVDGFNLQMQIKPNKGCQELSCTTDINAICPKELQKDGGCVTACKAGISEGIYRNATGDFPGNRNCCTGPFAIPEYCSLEMNDYYWLFKDACPKAYAYAYDDHKSLVTCDQKQQADYTITFCPTDAPSSAVTKAGHSSDQWLATQVCVPPTWTWLSWASENKKDKEPVTNVCERAKKNEAEPLDGEHTRSKGPAASSTRDFAPTSNPGGPAHNPAATKTGASKDTKAPAKTGAPPVPSKTGETKDSEGPAKTGLPSLQPDAFSGSKSAPVETVDESAGSGLTPMPTRTPSASDGPTSTLHPAASSNNPPASGLPGANLKLPIPIPTTGATDSEGHEGINLGAIPNDKPSCKRNKKRGMKKRLLESRQKESL